MQATLDSFALKPFTRALTCLSRYGDELVLYATPATLSLSVTSSSMSAYCRFAWDQQYFVRYQLGNAKGKSVIATFAGEEDAEAPEIVTGQILIKPLLAILRHRNVEKTVEKCELIIAEGSHPTEVDEEDEHDSLESTLVVRLYCQHGVIKTHKLLLHNPSSLLAPGVPTSSQPAHLAIPARTLKDVIDHFPVSKAGIASGKAGKSDPQMVWNFGDEEVTVSSIDMSGDLRGKPQLATELTLSADEFDRYELSQSVLTIAFHLREFNATVAFADSLSLSLGMRFTSPTEPLFIEIDGGDGFDLLSVISTSAAGATAGKAASKRPQAVAAVSRSQKRAREDSSVENSVHGTPNLRPESGRTTPRLNPQRVVQRIYSVGHARTVSARVSGTPSTASGPSRNGSMGPPSSMGPPPIPVYASQRSNLGNNIEHNNPPNAVVGMSSSLGSPLSTPSPITANNLPLFLPGSQPVAASQPRILSQNEIEAAADLAGVDEDDLWAALEDGGEDLMIEADGSVAVQSSQFHERELRTQSHMMRSRPWGNQAELDELPDDTEVLAPTQATKPQTPDSPDGSSKSFRPLFED